MIARSAVLIASAVLSGVSFGHTPLLESPSPSEPSASPTDAETSAAVARGLAYLLSIQNRDGSFGGVRNATFTSSFGNPGTYHCWQVGTTGLCVLALLEVGGGDAGEAIDHALDFLVVNAELRRPAEWDLDNNWGLIYGVRAFAAAVQHPRYRGMDREKELRRAGEAMLAGMKRYQSARGGWGYYADPGPAWRPDWATSFTTAAGVVALLEAQKGGFEVDAKMLRAAITAVERARLPNGAFDYDVTAVPRHLRLESINQVKGSLGRIQVCNYALLQAGVTLPEGAIATGVDQFFRHHKFLDVARNKPIPHEAYYANAAYFYLFGHYYAALTIDQLDEPERGKRFGELREKVLQCQQEDGSMWDFWIASNTKAYGTAFGLLALDRSLRKPPE